MTADVGMLEVFRPRLDELADARAVTDQFGKAKPTGNRLNDTRNSLNYEESKNAETIITDTLVEEINAADESTLTAAQKAIAVKVLAHTWRSPVDQSLEKIQAGFSAFERVQLDSERNRGIVAVLGATSISLFVSNGAEDITIAPVRHAEGHSYISLRLSGRSVPFKAESRRPMSRNQAPSPFVLNAQQEVFNELILSVGDGDNIAAQMASLDPASESYRPRFVRLGTRENPNKSLDEIITASATPKPKPLPRTMSLSERIRLAEQAKDTMYPLSHKRYAARLAIASMEDTDWISITPPDDEFKDAFTNYLARTYTDLLTDRVTKGKLITLNQEERRRIMFAADVSKDVVEAATRDIIGRRPEASDSALGVVRSLRSQYVVDGFFDSL